MESRFPAEAFCKSLSRIISSKFLMYKIALRNICSFGSFLLRGWITTCFRSSQKPSLIRRTRLRSRSFRFEIVSVPRRPEKYDTIKVKLSPRTSPGRQNIPPNTGQTWFQQNIILRPRFTRYRIRLVTTSSSASLRSYLLSPLFSMTTCC